MAVRRVWVIFHAIRSILPLIEQMLGRPRPQTASSMFLQHNTALVPPYRVLIDTNFINFSLQNKLELVSGMMDCLYAKCSSHYRNFSALNEVLTLAIGIPCVTDCVIAELEKLGQRYRVALRYDQDSEFSARQVF